LRFAYKRFEEKWGFEIWATDLNLFLKRFEICPSLSDTYTDVFVTTVDDVQLCISFLNIARLFDFAAVVHNAIYAESVSLHAL